MPVKWLKHMTASWDDEKLASLVGKGGMEGIARYGLYWRVNEIIASQMEGKSPSCSVRYPVSRWSLLLSLRGSLVFSTLSTLAVTYLVTVERDGCDIIVTNRNLLKYRDEYSRKSGQTPVQEGEEEGKGDIEKEEKRITPSAGADGELMAASWLCEELGVVADNGTRRVAADAIRLLAKEGGDRETATKFILQAGKTAIAGGQIINRFWFQNQEYRGGENGRSGKSKPSPAKERVTTTGGQLQKSLSQEDGLYLLSLLNRTAKRYPNQDLTDALPEYMRDFEMLALKYSLQKVEDAIAALRVNPDQDFFPTPNEVADRIERMRLKKVPSHIYSRG